MKSLHITILGLSITSSWGNGHATTFRALAKQLDRQGHRVHFLERDVPWYASHRDLPAPPYCRLSLYDSLDDLKKNHTDTMTEADLVIVGSYVPEGVAVGEWVTAGAGGVTAFYDIDTPVTLAKIENGDYEYLHPDLIPRFDLYLSFTGGPTLRRLETQYGAAARPLYCSVDPDLYYPEATEIRYDLGYLGTYSPDRQPTLDQFLVEPALAWPDGSFAVAGPQYPTTTAWPPNVTYHPHLPPADHRQFYNAQRFTLNVTRRDMIRAGYSPSVRLFEAAACGTPIISDDWAGLDTFFIPGEEILIAHNTADALSFLRDTGTEQRLRIGQAARQRVLREHTAAHRAGELVQYAQNIRKKQNA